MASLLGSAQRISHPGITGSTRAHGGPDRVLVLLIMLALLVLSALRSAVHVILQVLGICKNSFLCLDRDTLTSDTSARTLKISL